MNARVERFTEPVLLLTLRDGPTHGYDLAEALTARLPEDRIDYGNLYRLLRALEMDGIVESEWRHDLPGRSKRTYELTNDGSSLLDAWAMSLDRTSEAIAEFRRHYDEGSTG